MNDYDVVVVGAGTTGSACALAMARRGWRVAMLERRIPEQAGARWVNGVPGWMFDRAELPRPCSPELRAARLPFVVAGPSGESPLRVESSPLLQVDMRYLVSRLQTQAREAGVTIFGEVCVESAGFSGARPNRLDIRCGNRRCRLRARLFVDASGMSGALRRKLSGQWPRPGVEEVCSAAQQVHRIRDSRGASAWLARHGLRDGDGFSFLSPEGGFSTLFVQVNRQNSEVELLSGASAGEGRPSGQQMIDGFVSREDWIGERLFGGAGAIPLRAPYHLQGQPGIVLAGNSGCQVFPAHASGIGSGLIAARILADTAGRHTDPGSRQAAWAYTGAFMREIGAVNAAWDQFRCFSQTLTKQEVVAMLSGGLITSALVADNLAQRMPRLRPGDIAPLLLGVTQAPGVAARMVPVLTRMAAIHAHYRRYPDRPDQHKLQRWSRIAARL